jgi:hypothetical protein
MNKILMKKKQNQWKKLLISIVLLCVAVILSVILYPVWIIYTLWMIIDRIIFPRTNNAVEKSVWYLANTIKSIALWIDQIGNVIGRDLFNKILITRWWYKFGRVQETISSVLWHNQITWTLTSTGERLANLLDKIEKDHCKKAIIYFD